MGFKLCSALRACVLFFLFLGADHRDVSFWEGSFKELLEEFCHLFTGKVFVIQFCSSPF